MKFPPAVWTRLAGNRWTFKQLEKPPGVRNPRCTDGSIIADGSQPHNKGLFFCVPKCFGTGKKKNVFSHIGPIKWPSHLIRRPQSGRVRFFFLKRAESSFPLSPRGGATQRGAGPFCRPSRRPFQRPRRCAHQQKANTREINGRS